MKIKIIYSILLLLTISVKAQTLNGYLQIASENNPELKAIQYQYKSALEKVVEVGSLPNTTIGAGYFVQEAETRVGAQKAKFSISQMMPWFGTLEAKKESSSFNAAAQLNNFDFAKRKLFLDVKTVYYELFEIKVTRNIIQENIEILKTFEALALNELENNRATMVDVLKIRIEKNELENNLQSILENLKAKQITFNLLLNRDETILINTLDSLAIDNVLFKKELISENPQLLKLNNLQNALEKAELVSKKEGLPTIGIGLDYVIVENRAVENLFDNGKDIVMPMVTVSVPLFSKKYNSKQKQLQFDQKAIETTKIDAKNKLFTLFEKATSKMVNAKTSIKTQIENITEVDRAKKLLLAAYETSKIDFEQLLEIQQLKLKFQFKKVVSEKEYSIQKSNLEFLTKEN